MLKFEVDTLIIGAGLVGSSVAMHLSQRGLKDIRVIDFDLEGSLSSSELNAGGVRATWNLPINIQMSKLSIEYFSKMADQVGYRACGYLWLHSAEKLPAALKARETQIALGWPVEAWDLNELQKKVPFIDKTAGIAGALFAPRDGLVNPNLMKNYFRAEARAHGVTFDDKTLCRNAKYEANHVEILGERLSPILPHEIKTELVKGNFSSGGEIGSPHARVEYRAKRVINCAGAWASEVAEILKYPCPAFPVRRQVCIFDCRDVDLTPYGMIVDPSGVYFHPEATNGLAGFANHGEPKGVNYTYDGDQFFTETIWPALYERSSKFERLKHLTGWAGLYEVSPDESAILGQVNLGLAGSSGKVFEAHSFSGHGVMHSYAAGKLLAEKVLAGNYQTLDAEPLNGDRFENGRLLQENLVI